MFGVSFHCGNCECLASSLNGGKCPTCGSTAVVPAAWYQLSVDERSVWKDRIHGRYVEKTDPWRLSQPGIREKIVHPPLMSCTARAVWLAHLTPPSPPGLVSVLWGALQGAMLGLFAARQNRLRLPAPAATALLDLR
jgi:hypothetical protein